MNVELTPGHFLIASKSQPKVRIFRTVFYKKTLESNWAKHSLIRQLALI